MSNLMLDDKNAMDDINPFTDPENFFPPGTSKHTLDFKKYKAPVQEEQEEYVSPACDMLSKGVGRLGIDRKEHTSELQSHSDLVCRLLLEKKKK